MNAILHHCKLPSVTCLDQSADYDEEGGSDSSDGDSSDFFSMDVISRSPEASVRPGIVHRLDKGTSGLLVVAKVSGGISRELPKLGSSLISQPCAFDACSCCMIEYISCCFHHTAFE